MSDAEKKAIITIVEHAKRNNFVKEEAIVLSLLCENENISLEMIDYLQINPNADFYTVLDKAVEIGDKHGGK